MSTDPGIHAEALFGERRVKMLQGWGLIARSPGYVYRAVGREDVVRAVQTATARGRSVLPRGSGYSYGDVALNAGNLVLETTGMERILDWDANSGLIKVEPGVTIGRLIDHVAPHGWWPAVVPGTIHPTLGGCASSNIHGKNNWNSGTIGDHIVEMEVLLANGDIVTCGPGSNPDLFRAVVGGVGMLGVILSLSLRLRRVVSPLLHVEEYAAPDLKSMFGVFQHRRPSADFLVGWVDAYASGNNLGRGLIQIGNYVEAETSASVGNPKRRYASDRLVALLPHSLLWLAMKPVANDIGMRRINESRYLLGSLRSGIVRYLPQTGFQFFHDFAPNWNRAFQPLGIIQYQMFVPGAAAQQVFAAGLEETHASDIHPFLAVLKLHRRDDFLLSCGVDGYSLSLDFRMTRSNRGRLLSMLDKLTRELVLPAGGRFYLAKDSTLTQCDFNASIGEQQIARFITAKQRYDPSGVFQSDLYRRLFERASTGGTRALHPTDRGSDL